jgi:outer membrane lipoprotein LolB
MKWLVSLLPILLMAGCAAPLPAPSVDPEATWQSRQQHLKNMNDWRLNGRLAITRGAEAWYLKVNWRQKQNGYVIFISGPFGAGQVKLTGNPEGVELRDAERNAYYAKEPEILLYEHTGVVMPVTGLRYWILGLPDPGKNHTSQTRLDAYGRLAELQQRDWTVRFPDYVAVKHYQLPERLLIQNEDIEVRLVVDDWQVFL